MASDPVSASQIEKIFDKTFLFVPINQSLHWTLALVCWPGLIDQERDMFDEDEEGKAGDSAGSLPHLTSDSDGVSSPSGDEQLAPGKEEIGMEAERIGDNSVIVTPGPPPEPTKSDDDFIATSEEEVDQQRAVGSDDPDYDPDLDATDGTDGDEKGDLEGGRAPAAKQGRTESGEEGCKKGRAG